MKPEDVLPDAVDAREIGGVMIRKGTVAAFLANCKDWLAQPEGSPERAARQQEILAAVPALRALGFFAIVQPRDEQLRLLVEAH